MITEGNRCGIISVGNWIVDSISFIDTYPQRGNLVSIRKVEEGLGGCAHNVLVDLAALKSGIPLFAGGCVGDDRFGEMAMDAIRSYGIDGSNMKTLPGEATSYTLVMSETGGSGSRTFFHNRGANARLTADMVLSVQSDARIFHLGYLLLLDELDKPDEEYGVVAARVLKTLQERGYKTSVDVVSEEGDRFRSVVLPCLKYVDYLVINEVEAGACLGRELRNPDGTIDPEIVGQAAGDLMSYGVGELCVIHYPEGGVALKKGSGYVSVPSTGTPSGEIVSTVGAGDAFCAGCLFAIHEGYPVEEMLRFANVCARFNLYSPTSTGGAPSLDQVKAYLSDFYSNI